MKIDALEVYPVDQFVYVKIRTDAGLYGLGEASLSGRSLAVVAALEHLEPVLVGQDASRIEHIWQDIFRGTFWRGGPVLQSALAGIDIALWDLAGQRRGTSVSRLLGGFRKRLPTYASTYHGDHAGGLDSPEAYAAFAQQCRDMGYPAFKIHGWNKAPVAQEVATVLAVREAVGTGMDLMVDPACELTTFGDALKVGRACDEADFFWYEDPFRDGGISQFAHRKLRQLIRTPLLQTEHVRSLEPHIDFALADATDYIRGDIGYDGITGVMKLAHAAESLGMDIEFHGPLPAARQCMAAIRNTIYFEIGLVHPNAPASHPDELYLDHSDRLDSIDERGHVPVSYTHLTLPTSDLV